MHGSCNDLGDPLVLPASKSPTDKPSGVPIPLELLELECSTSVHFRTNQSRQSSLAEGMIEMESQSCQR